MTAALTFADNRLMAILQIPCVSCRAVTSAEEGVSAVSCATCGIALPAPDARAWRLMRGGGTFGPYNVAELAAYIAEGRILAADNIWHDGAQVRITVAQLPSLAAGPARPAPAPVPPQPVGLAKAEPVPAQPQPEPQPVSFAAPAQPGYPPQPHAAPGGGKAGLHVKRAFNWDLRSLPVEPDEEAILLANGVDEADARRYLVWRRSVLLVVVIPTLLSALLATLGTVTTDLSGLSGVGILLEVARLAALFVLPLTAWLAAKAWDRHRKSRTILLRGWLVGFLTPLVLALIPYSWRVDLSGAGNNINMINQVSAILGFVGAIAVYVTLMPAVLSLIPGVLRACLRIKALIPESMLPGLFLVAATPLYILLFLVIFTTVNQLVGNFLLILGIVALVGAPMLYLFNARTFTRPLRTDEEVAKIGSVQKTVLVVMGIGLALIVVYAFTATIMIPGQGGVFRQMQLLGFDSTSSVLQIWKPTVIQFPIEYIVRSLFTTVLVADLFMMMNLQLWQHTREFQNSPDAASYDRLMNEIEEAGGTPQGAPAA